MVVCSPLRTVERLPQKGGAMMSDVQAIALAIIIVILILSKTPFKFYMDFKNKKVSLELNTKPMNDQPSEDILLEDINDHSE